MKTTLKILRRAARVALNAFAPYLVLDEYGTSQCAWTLAEAADWLAVAAPRARIVNLYTRQIVADRRVA